eukprot:scaffold52196_cov72-Cyclotella_meneghiniana.AAC.2
MAVCYLLAEALSSVVCVSGTHVGVNRTLKKSVKSEWDDWMERTGSVTLEKPSRKLIGEWVLKAWDDLDPQTVRNSWKKKGFEWVL